MAANGDDGNKIAPKYPIEVPRFGLGCAPLGDLFSTITEAEAQALLNAAWDAGVRYYDTAPWYGHGLSEHRLGTLLRQNPRSEYFVSTKVGRVYQPAPRGEDKRIQWVGGLNFEVTFDYSADGFAASHAQSRMRLGQSSVDALIIHDLDQMYHGDAFTDHERALMDSGLSYLHDLKSSGEIAMVGMGINALTDFEHFAPTIDVDFFIVAMPYTLLEQAALHTALKTCEERGIKVVIGAPFASGILTDPKNENATYDYAPASQEIRDKAIAIAECCENYDVPISAAALQFPLFHPSVCSIIPGAQSADHVRMNVANLSRPIPAELWAELKNRGLVDPDAPVPT